MKLQFLHTGFAKVDQEAPSIKDFDFKRFMSSCTSSTSPVANLEPPAKRRKKSGGAQEQFENAVKHEVTSYLMEKPEPLSQDPLKWWKMNSFRFPSLSTLARQLLAAPPSSVESERLFSIGGNIYTTKRNRLTPEHGEMLMFLNFNLRAFNFQY